MKKLFIFFKKHFLLNSFFIFVGSLFWFLWRTGAKPSRYVYPCQKIARDNIGLFGPPALIFLLHKLRHNPRIRKNIILGILIFGTTVFFARNVYLGYEKIMSRKAMAQTVNSPKGTPRGTMPGRVVWMHDSLATGTNLGQYYNNVDLGKVNSMMDFALKTLTNQNSVGGAMAKIFTYGLNPCPMSGSTVNCTGKKIAIKVNFNNIGRGASTMDGNYQPVISILRALTSSEANVFSPFNQGDIYIYDVSRPIGDSSRAYFSQNIKASNMFPNVHVVGSAAQGLVEDAVSSSENFSLDSSYCMPDSSWGQEVPQLLKDADYIINMPLLKGHGMAGGATLSFKNYLGNIRNSANYHPCLVYDGNPKGLVAVYTASFHNPDGSLTSLDRKTKLILGDAIYGNPYNNTEAPITWNMFGDDSPNSLFVSQDVVAVDSVMFSTIMQENGGWDSSGEQYLIDAAQRTAGTGSLGVHENPDLKTGCTDRNNLACWKYTLLDFVPCDLQGTMDVRCTSTQGVTPTLTPTPPTSTPTPQCGPKGDIDCSGQVNALDLVKLILDFFTSSESSDLDNSGQVNSLDLSILFRSFGN